MKFIISGASGWLGREFVYALLRSGELASLDDALLFSSSRKIIDFGEFGKAKSEPFLELDIQDMPMPETFVHLAFLTRDLIDNYGLENYLSTNQALTGKAEEIIVHLKPSFVVNISSGAVFNRSTQKLEISPNLNPYGFGKIQEEFRLQEACIAAGSNISIGRLWGCSGEFMPINRAYALSDLIVTALTERRISIKSKGKVFRRYCDAGEFTLLLYFLARRYKHKIINSGGPTIEIGELASLIESFVGSVKIERSLDPGALVDDYFPRESEYEKMSTEFGLPQSSMQDQVRRTILGHKRLLAALA